MGYIHNASIALALLAGSAGTARAEALQPLPRATDAFAAAIDLDDHTLCLATREGLRDFVRLVPDGGRVSIYPLAAGKALIIGVDSDGAVAFSRFVDLGGVDTRFVEMQLFADSSDRIWLVGIDESKETHFGMPRPDGTWVWLDDSAAPSDLRPLGPEATPVLVDSDTAGCRYTPQTLTLTR